MDCRETCSRKTNCVFGETYVHKNYKPKKSWRGPGTSGAVESISSRKRHIVVHAGHENGFVPNALLVYSTKSKLADYHHDMNASNFNKWLEEKLILNLDKPSVVVMDNASYHSVVKNKAPTTQTNKPQIKEWLTQHGHEVLRLPSYHCYLNPIELIWSQAERKIAKKNIGLSAQDKRKTDP
ncbi:uncharacterized protein LOC134746889 [Cydia strobilella]|uniref:uncharacterized protein LOC134746889 n=1 Tax=Cydia strobilella TaxID=1100964 RepID=UPI003004EDFF